MSGMRSCVLGVMVASILLGCDPAGSYEWVFEGKKTGDCDIGDNCDDCDSDDGQDVVVVLDEDFNDWDENDERFFISNRDEVAHPDSGTMAMIDGERCLSIHNDVVDNSGYGYMAEFEMFFDDEVDMSGEDFKISFDVFMPEETFAKNAFVQFAFFEIRTFTPIYSEWISVTPEEWNTIEANIDTTSGAITFSGFENDPDDWTFGTVRIQVVVNDDVEEGDDIRFYVDNLRIADDSN